jgi:Protein of unknown function (DUF4232)
MRSAFIAGVAALALLIGGSSLAATHSSAASRCTTGQLVVWMDTEGNGAAGSVFYKLQFTNLSRHRCTLFGYPGVSAVDLHGHQLGSPAARLHTHPRRVTLGKGATTRATLQIVEALNFPKSRCHPVKAAGLRVFPPNTRTSRIVPFPFDACSRHGLVYMNVKPVHR